MNVCFGGTLWQDLAAQTDLQICHVQSKARRGELTHCVILCPDSRLRQVMESDTALVNTYHHQAIRQLAPGFQVGARSKDGLIESIESEDGLLLGVQWHPEELQGTYPPHAALFQDLVRRCQSSKPRSISKDISSIA